MKEIEELQCEIQQLKNQIAEIKEREKERERQRRDIVSRLRNKDKLNYIFQIYDNLHDENGFTGMVALRHRPYMANEFSTIRNLAKHITNYNEFFRRKNKYVDQKTIKRNLNQLDDAELELVAQCTDEIIDVLYKYKRLCEEHQNIDYSDFISENQ